MSNKFKFERTQFGWKTFVKQGNAYIFFGHFYTQRLAKERWAEDKHLEDTQSLELNSL